MLLIEEFLDNCYQISQEVSELGLNALLEYIEDNFERIEDPLLRDNEISTKLGELKDYILGRKGTPVR